MIAQDVIVRAYKSLPDIGETAILFSGYTEVAKLDAKVGLNCIGSIYKHLKAVGCVVHDVLMYIGAKSEYNAFCLVIWIIHYAITSRLGTSSNPTPSFHEITLCR